MKHALRLCAITFLFSAAGLQCSQSRDIKVTLLAPSSVLEVYVTLTQDGKTSTQVISLLNLLRHHKTFKYSPTGGVVTLNIYLAFKDRSEGRYKGSRVSSKQLSVSEILGKQIFISDDPANASLKVELKWSEDAPSKKKIRAYKTTDEKVDWTVQITDNSGNKISQSTFKKNTDGVATVSLKLRLNPTEIPADGPEALKRYNANIVKVFKGKKIDPSALKFTKPITVADFNAVPNGELQINADDAKIVVQGSEPK